MSYYFNLEKHILSRDLSFCNSEIKHQNFSPFFLEKDALMEERIAVEKSAMAKAAEARAAVARAAVGVTESSLFAAEIEAEAAEAEAVSKRAYEAAQVIFFRNNFSDKYLYFPY